MFRYTSASRRSNFIPHAPDRGVQGVLESDERLVGPEAPTQLLAQHYLAWVFKQCKQRLKRMVLKFVEAAVSSQLTGSPVQFERAEPQTEAATGSSSERAAS
jgi:hypothetical protein